MVPERVHDDEESQQQAANVEKCEKAGCSNAKQRGHWKCQGFILYTLCQWHTFFSEAALLTPLQTVSTTGNQLSEHWRL